MLHKQDAQHANYTATSSRPEAADGKKRNMTSKVITIYTYQLSLQCITYTYIFLSFSFCLIIHIVNNHDYIIILTLVHPIDSCADILFKSDLCLKA